MARLTTYQTDNEVQGTDRVLGTDTGGATKNYTLDSIGEYFSKNNSIKSNTAFAIKFVNSVSDIGYATISRLGFGGGGTSMTNFTGFLVSKYNSSGDSIEKLVRRVFGNEIIISNYNNQDIYCNYKVNSISESDDYPNFLEIDVTSAGGIGVFIDDEHFIISVSSLTGDKNYEHEQSSPSAEWVVTHNLNKRPSVTVVDSAGTEIMCEVQHDSDNQVTLIFDSSTSGQAYFN
jgi:hypothetical protein